MLVFLDIDGVMVPAKGWKAPENLEDGMPMFTQKSIVALSSLLFENTTIILSSSHRNRFTISEWKRIFEKRGLKVNSLSSLGLSDHLKSRKDEILEWFNINSVSENFVIIDDDTSLNGLPEYLKEHLILTSPMIGLTLEHIEQIETIKKKRHFV